MAYIMQSEVLALKTRRLSKTHPLDSGKTRRRAFTKFENAPGGLYRDLGWLDPEFPPPPKMDDSAEEKRAGKQGAGVMVLPGATGIPQPPPPFRVGQRFGGEGGGVVVCCSILCFTILISIQHRTTLHCTSLLYYTTLYYTILHSSIL